MKIEKAKLSDIIENITAELKSAIKRGVNGVAYMYVVGTKILSVSVENITDDLDNAKQEQEANPETSESTNTEGGK